MAFLKTRGIVIKEVSTGEADKIITIFSRNRGRITAMARGGKRSKSQLSAGSQIMCYCEYVLYSGKEMYSVNSCEVLEPFYEIRNDIVKLTYAAHFMDIVLEIVQENQPSPKLLQLLLNSLYMLAKTDKAPELVSRVFELRAVTIAGYAPYVRSCMICGQEPDKSYAFSYMKCGFICDREKCAAEDRTAPDISIGTVRTIQHIVYAKMEELFSFRMSPEVSEELALISKRYLRERLERDFKKLDFLKSI